MFKIDGRRIKIDIELENGIYVFESESGVGKTYLAKVLQKYRTFNEPVASYGYENFSNGMSLEKLLDHKFKVVVIDRYDMYSSKKLNSVIEKYRKDSVILVDCKITVNAPKFDDIALIDRDNDRIRVF